MHRFIYRISTFCILLVSLGSRSSADNPPALPPVLPNPSGCQLGLPIHDFSCNNNHQFQINVQNAPGDSLGNNVYLKEVRFIINHEWVADLDITLSSPSGAVVELSTDNGSGSDNYGNPINGLCNEYTSLISNTSPEACNALDIRNAQAPFIGHFLPEGNLSTFNNGTSPNGLWTLQICDDGKEHHGMLEYVELVFEAVACITPSVVEVGYADSTMVQLNWSDGGNCTTSILEFGPPGFLPGVDSMPGGGTVVYVGCPPVVLSGLLPSTDYELYIREYCGSGSFSANACPVNFSTSCSPPPATLVESFNNQTLCSTNCPDPCQVTGTWTNAKNDDFDWILNAGPTLTSLTGPLDDVPGGGIYIYLESSPAPCRSNNMAVLISNCIEVHASADSCDMSFNYMLYGVNVKSVALEITTNGGMTWQPLWSAQGNLGSSWKKQFIDLDDYDGQIAQFRFVGEGGNGNRGDIALDNLVFYGSEDLGFPSFVYYLDEDQDGYGRQDIFVATCQPITMLGFVPNDDDCDDSAPWINPGEVETPCDYMDANCNGLVDEFFLPALTIQNDTICSGGIGQVEAQPTFGGTVYWYDALVSGNLLHEGLTYSPPNFPVNNTDGPLTMVFFAEEITFDSCVTPNRSMASITILPQPALTSIDSPVVCAGTVFDLNTLDIVDENGANGQISFHTQLPPNPGNQISSTIIPQANTPYYIVSTSNGGCRDIAHVFFEVKPSPAAFIAGDTTLCYGASQSLVAIDTGSGIQPLTYEWNNGSVNPLQNITSNAIKGVTDLYAVTITGTNGCSSSDTILVKTVTSVDSVQTSVQPVSSCNGSDGAITILPLNGTSPFNYEWDDNLIANQPGPLTVQNLLQGTYSFTITDSSPDGCPFFLPVVVVNGPSAVVEIEEVTPVSCANGADGCIQLEVIGNAPDILWNTGETTAEICGLSAGAYTVTVTEGSCSNVLTINVPQPEHLKVFPTVEDATCHNLTDGRITLNVFGGTPPYQYFWSNGLSTKSIGNLAAGAYDVTVTDAQGCQLSIQGIIVKQPDFISIGTDLIQPQCFGSNNGEIHLQLAGGTSPYSIAWNNGGTGSMINNLAANQYQVTVADSKGCTATGTYALPQPNPLEILIDSQVNPTCNGVSNGSISITPSGGNGGFTFEWSNLALSEDLLNIGQGNYSVIVTDQMGCTFTSDSIMLVGPENLDITTVAVSPPCVGIDSGFIEVTVNGGGQGPYEFYWSTDDSECCLYGLPAGPYTVEIVDGQGCIFDTTFNLVTQQPITVLDIDTVPPACHGTATGQISIVLTGGMEPYDIVWSNAKHGNSISNLLAGNYAATVTAANNCVFNTDLIPLVEPEELSIKLENIEDIACYGGADGSIDITVTGGVAPYDIVWSNNATSEDLSELNNDTYFVTITDANQCVTVSVPLVIHAPDSLAPFSTLLVPPGCEIVENVDTVCVGAVGGTAPYQFLWDTGDTTVCLIHPQVGDYHVTVTDAAGCTEELMSVKVPEIFFPVEVELMDAGTKISCAGEETGEMSAIVQGGLAPYNFIWSNGETGFTSEDTLTNSNLSSGMYNVTVTDNTGCVVVSEWSEIISNPLLLLSVPNSQLQHVSCKNNQDGAIDLTIAGGQSPFDIVWTNEDGVFVSNGEDIENLGAGSYSVHVTDVNGCTRSISATITEPSQALSLLNPPPQLQHVSCFGLADGSIDLTVTGGTPPYDFHWTNNDSTEDLSSLPPGQYAVTVTDANICAIQSIPYTILQPSGPVVLQTVDIENIDCFGYETGSIQINMIGGTPAYSFNWQSNNNEIFVEEDLTGIAAGTYELIVLDQNACLFDTMLVVSQPDSFYLLTASTPADPNQSNGTATVSVIGGQAPYIYMWEDGQNEPTAEGLPPGWYSVTVTDAAGCETIAYVQVHVFSATTEGYNNIHYHVFPNPTSGKVYLELRATLGLPFEWAICNSMGLEVFRQEKDMITNEKLEANLRHLPSGIYFLRGMSNGQRLFTEKLILHQP